MASEWVEDDHPDGGCKTLAVFLCCIVLCRVTQCALRRKYGRIRWAHNGALKRHARLSIHAPIYYTLVYWPFNSTVALAVLVSPRHVVLLLRIHIYDE